MSDQTIRIEGTKLIVAGTTYVDEVIKIVRNDVDLPVGDIAMNIMTTMRHRGAWLKFENGWTLSMQWGNHNYCANNVLNFTFNDKDPVFQEACPDAELAAWDKDSRWLVWHPPYHVLAHGTEVEASVPAEQINTYIEMIRNFPEEIVVADEGWLHDTRSEDLPDI